MCISTPNTQDQERLDPGLALSNLIGRELGVSIDRYSLALFLKLHWDEVAKLAHEIHGGRK